MNTEVLLLAVTDLYKVLRNRENSLYDEVFCYQTANRKVCEKEIARCQIAKHLCRQFVHGLISLECFIYSFLENRIEYFLDSIKPLLTESFINILDILETSSEDREV